MTSILEFIWQLIGIIVTAIVLLIALFALGAILAALGGFVKGFVEELRKS